MQARIQGTTMPVLDVLLDPNESVYSESGELSWMTGSIQMQTHTQMGGGVASSACSSVSRRRQHLHDRVSRIQYPGEVSFAPRCPATLFPSNWATVPSTWSTVMASSAPRPRSPSELASSSHSAPASSAAMASSCRKSVAWNRVARAQR